MRCVGAPFGHHHAILYLAGIFVSWLCFVLAMVALYSLARLDLPRRGAERAVLLTAIFPFSFFFGVAYSESTFLLFTLLAFYLFRTRRWMLGGVCGGIATATRVPGIMMWPALAWIAWRAAEPTSARSRSGAAAGLVLVAAGFGAYCAYIYGLTGNPLEWAATLQRWGYYPGGMPWTAPVAPRRAARHAPVPLPCRRSHGAVRRAVRCQRHRCSCRGPVRVAAVRRRLRRCSCC